MHGGGPRRTPAIALALLEHRADIVVLTEFRRTFGGQIAGVLFDHGLRHQHTTDPPKGTNGILIAARFPMAVCEPECGSHAPGPAVVATRQRRLAEVTFPDMGFGLVGLHIPCDGRGTGREAVFQAALVAAARRRDEGLILLGDFNAGRHRIDEEGETFTCTRLLGRLASMGYIDAWREKNPDSRQFSWYGHSKGQAGAGRGAAPTGFRIDHAFVSAALAPRVSACWYSHNERCARLSDHSALLLELA